MPLVRHEEPQILVEIQDQVDGSTRIKRKARFLNMTYSQGTDFMFGSQPGDSVILNLMIEQYAAGAQDPVSGVFAYGERLNKRGYQDYPFQIIANNTSVVDATTGEVLCERAQYDNALRIANETGVELELVLPDVLKGRNFMFEGERFRMIASSQPITVDPMIVQNIQQADAAGRFNQV